MRYATAYSLVLAAKLSRERKVTLVLITHYAPSPVDSLFISRITLLFRHRQLINLGDLPKTAAEDGEAFRAPTWCTRDPRLALVIDQSCESVPGPWCDPSIA